MFSDSTIVNNKHNIAKTITTGASLAIIKLAHSMKSIKIFMLSIIVVFVGYLCPVF